VVGDGDALVAVVVLCHDHEAHGGRQGEVVGGVQDHALVVQNQADHHRMREVPKSKKRRRREQTKKRKRRRKK
jgi:hypothetical protein